MSAAFFAIHYIGFPETPAPIIADILLPVGLLLAAIGQRMPRGGWQSCTEVLHVRLAAASLVYLGWAASYSMKGVTIHWYPAGLIATISAMLVISRLLAAWPKLHATIRNERRQKTEHFH